MVILEISVSCDEKLFSFSVTVGVSKLALVLR
jgi:hypothetical protein